MLDAEFREKLEAISMEEMELRLIISRVENTLAASQVRLYEEISAIEHSLKEVSRVSKELDATQEQQQQLKEMFVGVEKINSEQEREIKRLEKIMKSSERYVRLLNSHSIILILFSIIILLHAFGLL